MSSNEPLLEVENLHKHFGSIRALDGMDIRVNEGEIMGLVGDNGAGKSTLIKCLVGYHQPDDGEIYWKGDQVNFENPDEALDAGIRVVYQDIGLADTISVARNLFIGSEPTKRFGRLNVEKMHEEAEKVLDEIGLKSLNDPTLSVENLSGGEQQSVKIGRALYFDADLLILDEPLRALSVKEGEKVLRTLKRTRDKGVSMIYITHNIFHAYEVGDRFQLIDAGDNAGEYDKAELDGPEQLIESLKYVAGGGDLTEGDGESDVVEGRT